MSVCGSTVLEQLWKLAGGDPTDAGSDWNDTFEPVGLILLAPPRSFGYWCTPVNSVTFATTGGDGVHYGLLSTNGDFSDFSPIVMTVPMCDTPNTIVGANLKEFLALGCRYGYFALEQLVYDRRSTLHKLELARLDPEAGQDERVLLQKLVTAFNIKPWATPAQRLDELHSLFASTIQLPPDAGSAA